MSNPSYDVVVIGAGPGGEVGAIRAAQLGLKVALVEKSPHLGGTCLNVGCIPSKALIEAARTYSKLQHLGELGFRAGTIEYDWHAIMDRKDKIVDQQRKGLRFLMKKNAIDVLEGYGRLVSPTSVAVTDSKGSVRTVQTKNVLLATGSRVRELPFVKSDGRNILTSDSVLFIDHVPESLCIVGGGVIGMEFASLFGRFGCKVTVIEILPQILPTEDTDTIAELLRALRKQNVTIETSTTLTGIENKGDHVVVTTKGGTPRVFKKALIATGREPVTQDIGLEKIGVKCEKGFVSVDAHYRSSVANVFAVGDIINTPALAHTASAEAMHAVEVIAGHKPSVIDYSANPNAIYTYPEIASIGFTENTLKEKGIVYKAAQFPFAPLAKAKIELATEGFVKILFEPKYREILGVHIVGAKATECIAEFVLGKILETTVDEIAHAIHPHPTLSETIMEAAHAALGGAVHA